MAIENKDDEEVKKYISQIYTKVCNKIELCFSLFILIKITLGRCAGKCYFLLNIIRIILGGNVIRTLSFFIE